MAFTELIHRITHRAHLTPYERHNLQMSHVPLAVVTASLGGHATDFANHRYLTR